LTSSCCGRPCGTLFCPHCGKRVSVDPLVALLDQCRVTARKLRSTANGYRRKIGNRIVNPDGVGTDWYTKKVESLEKSAAKWDSWADALSAKIKDGGDQ
jgi:hypothetical protein